MTCTTYIYNWNNCMICCFTSKEYLVVEEILRLFYLKRRLIKNLIFKKKKKKDSTSEERVLLQNAKHCYHCMVYFLPCYFRLLEKKILSKNYKTSLSSVCLLLPYYPYRFSFG